MTSTEEREIIKLNNSRLLREAGRELLPLLTQMQEAVIAKIVNAHREGTLSLLPSAAAELSVLTELTNKILRNEKELSRKEGELI